MRKADYQQRVERFAHIARLANAVQIPGRDPSHVRDLLRVDVKAGDSERSIDHIIGTEATPDGDDVADGALAEDDAEPRWWERIPGLHDDAREAFRARQLHARANYQLAAGKRGNTRDLSKAKLLYEDAIRCYKRVNHHDPANGSYALCLIDYGLLLSEMGFAEQAVEQFRKVREDVFPRDAKGESPTMPRSLVIDSLGYEASALQVARAVGRGHRPPAPGRPRGPRRRRPALVRLQRARLAQDGAARRGQGPGVLPQGQGVVRGARRERPVRLQDAALPHPPRPGDGRAALRPARRVVRPVRPARQGAAQS